MAHYDTFRDQLAIAHPAFGYALWEPDPGDSLPVEVGDVGFIRNGKFHRLFNALLPANHPSHETLGVPDDYEPLRPRMQDHVNRGTLSPNTFYSYGVTVVSGGLDVPAAETTGAVQDSFSFTRKYGAVLSFPVTARREDTLVLGHFSKWIIRHIDTWFAFAEKHKLGIEMEDIILVTGCHRTRTWTNVAFNEIQAGGQESAGLQIPGTPGAITSDWPVSSQHSQGTVIRHGPSGEDSPENQCIFLRGYRVARTSKILSRAARAVGPDPSPSDSERDRALVPIPGVAKYRDPLHVLLEYIAKRAPPHCDMVLVHDDDLTRLSGIVDGGSLEALNPDTVMRLIQRSEPQIKTLSGSDVNDDSLSTVPVPHTAAMLQTSRHE